MVIPAAKRRRRSETSDSMDNDDGSSSNTSASDASVEPKERSHSKEVEGYTPPTLPRRNMRLQPAVHGVTEHVGSFESTKYTSNVFTLQAEEMLRQIRLSSYEKRMAKVDAALREIKQMIEDLPDMGPLAIEEAETELFETRSVRIPFPDPPPDRGAKYTFSYERPSNINVVGSYSRKAAILVHGMLTIDLAVTMPAKIFQEKDYLNFRYFYKRAFYLARIAAGIKDLGHVGFDIEFGLQNDNHLQPIILVKFNQAGSHRNLALSRCQIRILLAADGHLFPAGKTLPDKNSIRSTVRADSNISPEEPTPFYNSSLRSECCSFNYLKVLHNSSLRLESFSDACILGKVWLQQRGFGAGVAHGGFGHFEWACIMALLTRGGGPHDKPILSKGYNSHQIFKATLLYLSVKDFIQNPICIGNQVSVASGKAPIFFDGTRGLNILFKMSPWSYSLLRQEASRTLRLLNDPFADQFNACFITKVDNPIQRYDFLASFPLLCNSLKPLSSTDAHEEITNYCMKSHQVITKGLGDRALLVNVQAEFPPSWAVTTGRSPTSQTSKLTIGLLLDPKHVNQTVDRGPSAEDKAVSSAFRRFWGEKAELRRFKDGSIVESLNWSSSSNQSVIEQILTHTLQRHLGDEASNGLSVLGETFGQMLPANQVTDPVALYRPVIAAYEILERQIRALEGMPLQIRQVSVGDAQLRYTSLSTSWLGSVSKQMKIPANVYIQFEGSSRWPDDLAAIQRTKTAFLLKIGELLQNSASNPSVTTRLGLENHGNDLSNVAFLDVNCSNGALFRLRIHHERELRLLERALASASSGHIREATATALSAYKRNFVQSPLHTQGIRTLCTRFPLLSPSIRLMKKWRDSHLLSNHVSDELIELLTTRSFVQPHAWAVPASIVTGFLRTLTFISTWDWRSGPLIVDLSGEMTLADYEAINTRFEAWRKIDPAMNRIAIFAASNLDLEGISWTELGPSKVVAARLTSLARAACGVVKEQGLNVQAAPLFAPSLSDYDFIVRLNAHATAKGESNRMSRVGVFKNLQIEEGEDPSLSSFEPIQSFLEELRRYYGSNIIFFHNETEGSVIGGLWNPQTGPRSWRVKAGYSTIPLPDGGEETGQVTINKDATLHDIARLGGDLVSTIEENR